jgi:hypothetical protein
MATITAVPEVRESTHGIPWYVWCSVVAVASAMIGGHWDIAWHRSIGRDSFWTPAHIALYFCGVLAGISCGYLILSTTFRQAESLDSVSVRVWGFRGPLGAFIAVWGGIAMLTSAPFDNWWHNAYGLDVKIVSPPHVLLIMGIAMVEVGGLILILGNMNRAHGALREKLNWLFLFVGAMVLVIFMILIMEYTDRVSMHTARYYRIVATFVPVVLAGIARASHRRWAATTMAGFYMLFVVSLVWILPLVPAEPKLGPVFYPVKQFVPPEFPFLLIVPAFAMDLLWRRTSHWGALRQAAVSGVVFVAVFAAVQWPFANFLMSPGARNWFFSTHHFGYYVSANSMWRQYRFGPTEQGAALWIGAAKAVFTAGLMSWARLRAGKWMQGIRR